jgi:hypothetical protein
MKSFAATIAVLVAMANAAQDCSSTQQKPWLPYCSCQVDSDCFSQNCDDHLKICSTFPRRCNVDADCLSNKCDGNGVCSRQRSLSALTSTRTLRGPLLGTTAQERHLQGTSDREAPGPSEAPMPDWAAEFNDAGSFTPTDDPWKGEGVGDGVGDGSDTSDSSSLPAWFRDTKSGESGGNDIPPTTPSGSSSATPGRKLSLWSHRKLRTAHAPCVSPCLWMQPVSLPPYCLCA